MISLLQFSVERADPFLQLTDSVSGGFRNDWDEDWVFDALTSIKFSQPEGGGSIFVSNFGRELIMLHGVRT